MKNVVIFGATGRTGKYILRKFQQLPDVKLTLFVRSPDKLTAQEKENVTVIQGDAMNPDDVKRAMAGQDVLLCSLEG